MQTSAPGRRRDWIGLGCVGCIALGWFAMDSLEVRFGHLRQGTRFYELLAVLRYPAGLLLGIDDGSDGRVIAFALLCLLVLGAALAPALLPGSAARRGMAPAGALPLSLMLLTAAALYRSGLRLDAYAPPDTMRQDLLRLAQDALGRVQGALGRRVAIGAGAYLSLVASLVLALRSLLPARRSASQPD
jgi:hypothetical protein